MKRMLLSLAGVVTLFGLVAPPVQSEASAIPMVQTQAEPEATTITGTILKNGENFVLSDSITTFRYTLDNSEKASPYEGRRVKVTGTIDVISNLIHVESIQDIA